jgi:hypothetical protein
MPANDWRLVSLLVSLLNTNHPQDLASANPLLATDWLPVLDQIGVWTNTLTDQQVRLLQITGGWPHYDPLVMTADTPQAVLIANALATTRANQPTGVFRDPGDVLATPELSLLSPWLRWSTAQVQYGLTDEVYEIIPSQLLARLRPDSIGALTSSGGVIHIQFTGFDDTSYVVETSSNLQDWLPVSTNSPTNCIFEITEPPPETGTPRFYRSVWLP